MNKQELYEQLMNVMDGNGTEQQRRDLSDYFENHPEQIELFTEFIMMHSLLFQPNVRVDANSMESSENIKALFREMIQSDEKYWSDKNSEKIKQIQEKVKREAEEKLELFLYQQRVEQLDNAKSSSHVRSFLPRITKTISAIAACLLLGCVAWLLIKQEPTKVVAKIINADNPIWSVATSIDLENRDYHLLSGLAEIEFNDGAKVILEGPSKISLESANGAYLQQGKLSVWISKGAEGFYIETPSAKMVDYGTEFSVEVAENGVSKVHVFEGLVGLFSGQGKNKENEISLRAGMAKSISSDGLNVQNIVLNNNGFVRQMKGESSLGNRLTLYQQFVSDSMPLAYWSFNQKTEAGYSSQLGSDNYFLDAKRNCQKIINREEPMLGSSVRFDGKRSYLQMKEPLPGQCRDGISISFWLLFDKLRLQTIFQNEFKIGRSGLSSQDLTFIGNEEGTVTIAFSGANTDLAERLESDQKWVRNQWSHIVVTITNEGEILSYKDGQPMKLYRTENKVVQTLSQWPKNYCWNNIFIGGEEGSEICLAGALDEVILYDRVIRQKEVQNLFQLIK